MKVSVVGQVESFLLSRTLLLIIYEAGLTVTGSAPESEARESQEHRVIDRVTE